MLVLKVRGVQAITGFEDVRAPVGLDLLVPGAGLFAGTVLNGINPFSVWGVWLTGTGISITHKTSRGAAIAVAAAAFLIMLFIVSLPTLFAAMMTKQ
jgi:Mg2+/Co2+ transporter CorB